VKNLLLSTLLLSLVSASGNQADAGFISQDLPGNTNPADGLVTKDTETGLLWLDWSFTKGISRGTIDGILYGGSGALIDNVNLSGWDYATREEVLALFGSASIPANTSWNNVITHPQLHEIFSKISITHEQHSQDYDYYTGFAIMKAAPANWLNAPVVDFEFENERLLQRWSGHQSWSEEAFDMPQNYSHDLVGHALVWRSSTVPVPSSLTLIGIGMVGIAGIQWRNRRKALMATRQA